MRTATKVLLLLTCALPILSEAGGQGGPSVDVQVTTGDGWYGEGYYYGIWFDDEDDYWAWRRRHSYYPANRRYYNRNRRVYYNHRDYYHRDYHNYHGGGGRHR